MTVPIREADASVPATGAGQPPQSTRMAVALALLACAGQACALTLVDVRPYAVFQHYWPWSALASHPIAIIGVLLQTVVVLGLGWSLRRHLVALGSGLCSIALLVVIAGLFAFSLAVPAESVARYAGEVGLAGILALVATLNLLLAGLVCPAPLLTRVRLWLSQRVTLEGGSPAIRSWDRYLPWIVALWMTVVSAVASVAVLERVPHIDDSISNYFQARYFAEGRLAAPAPPDPDSFQMDQTVVADGKWFGYAFPAWPAVLAIGVFFGVPWLVNPILSGLMIVIAHALIVRRYGRGTANVATLLLATSPWLIYMSAEFMAHPLTAVLVVAAALAFDRAADREAGWVPWAAMAGAATGALVLTRAIDAVLLAAGIGAAVLVERRLIRALPAALVTGVCAALVAALMLPYNMAVTGRATYPPHMAWSDGHWGAGVDRLGFGPDVGIRAWPNLDPLPGHGPADVVLNANKNFFMANVDLFGWAAGSLLFVWIAIALGRWRRADSLTLTLIASYVAGYSCYWFSGGPDLGPRYWYPLIVPMAVLSARGIEMLSAAWTARPGLTEPSARIGAMLIVASMSGAFVMVPWRGITKHYRYRGISGEIRQLAAVNHIEHGLVFVRPDRPRDYQSAFNFNPATIDDPATIYARDEGAEHRAAVIARFADRPIWVVGRDPRATAEPAPLVVLAGPLAPGVNPR